MRVGLGFGGFGGFGLLGVCVNCFGGVSAGKVLWTGANGSVTFSLI